MLNRVARRRYLWQYGDYEDMDPWEEIDELMDEVKLAKFFSMRSGHRGEDWRSADDLSNS